VTDSDSTETGKKIIWRKRFSFDRHYPWRYIWR
jgi:hypothetical protein